MKRFIVIFVTILITLLILSGCVNKTKIIPVNNQNKAVSQNKAQSDIAVSQNKNTTSDRNDADSNTIKEDSTSTPAEQTKILLKSGDSGDKVTELQKKLYTVGYDLTIDGVYGNQTSEDIKKLQQAENIDVSGNLDIKTDEILKEMKDVRTYAPPIKAAVPVIAVNNSVSQVPQGLTSIPDIKTSPGDSQQVIVILAQSYGTINASLKTYEKQNGFWKLINSGSAVTGINGFSDNRHEGDLTSPTGKYGIPFLFGNANNPGTKFPYRKVQTGDYWVSNKILSEYNVLMHYDGSDVKERFYDYEALWTQPLYKYAAVIDFNYGSDKMLGRGSGIFLHIAPPAGGGTLGCIGVSETNLVQILKWLDPTKKPVIIMGVKGHI